MKSTKQQLTQYFRAGYAGIILTSFEERRVEAELAAISKEIGYDLYVWSITDSLEGPIGADKPMKWMADDGSPIDPVTLLDKMNNVLPERSIVLAKDYHLFLADTNPVMLRKMKDALDIARNKLRRLVVLGSSYKLMPELEKEFTVIDFTLPDRDQLNVCLEGIATSAGITLNGNRDQILDAALGMTTTEAENAFALAVIESNGQDMPPAVVSREKANVVRKNGILEIIEQRTKLEDIGGLEILKEDLWAKRNLFTREARDYGLQAPRGILVVGQAGTGKSLTASAMGSIFNIPLVRLEAGKLFGSLVGASEANWRSAFSTAKAIAPCVLWVDEAESLTAGAKSSGATDGGTTLRVVKAMLQDMQFNSDGIMWCFTANDIDGFPDALVDRLDIWYVDLPNQQEREAIWAIHIAKRGRKPDAFSIPTIAKLTEGFSGRQIEQVWLAAMVRAFNDAKRDPVTDDITAVASQFIATSITMAATIEARRKRLEGRAKAASAAEVKAQAPKGRKLSV